MSGERMPRATRTMLISEAPQPRSLRFSHAARTGSRSGSASAGSTSGAKSTNSAMPRSSDMAPQFAAGDAADRGAGHTVESADGSGAPACRHGGADLHHVRDGEFGTGVALAADAFRPLV